MQGHHPAAAKVADVKRKRNTGDRAMPKYYLPAIVSELRRQVFEIEAESPEQAVELAIKMANEYTLPNPLSDDFLETDTYEFVGDDIEVAEPIPTAEMLPIGQALDNLNSLAMHGKITHATPES